VRKVDAPCFVIDRILYLLKSERDGKPPADVGKDYLNNGAGSCMCRARIGDTLFSGSGSYIDLGLSDKMLEYLTDNAGRCVDSCSGYLAGPKTEDMDIAKAIEAVTRDFYELTKFKEFTSEQKEFVDEFLKRLDSGEYTKGLVLNA